MAALLRRHWLFALVLAAAALVRLAMILTFWPALFYPGDSFGYLASAYGQTFVRFDVVHPSGYPLAIELLSLPGRSAATLAIAQHFAGLAIGVLVYVLLVRLDVNRYLAAVAAGFVLLNSWQVVLEQHILAEAFFALALTGSAALLILRQGPPATAVSGLLLACAVLLRAIGLAAVPVWLVYAAWKRRFSAALAVGAIALAVPLLAYASAHAAAGRGFALTEFDGWVLYGRVAAIADCAEVDVAADAEGLCESAADRQRHRELGWTPSRYVFDAGSPAQRLFGEAPREDANDTLRGFAVDVIRDRPLTYARTVASNLGWAFRPDAGSTGMDPGIFLHEHYEDLSFVDEHPVVQAYLGGYELRSFGPRDLVVDYAREVEPPRLVLGALFALPLMTLLVALIGRGRLALPHLPESTFLVATAIALFVGAVAVAELNLRFLVPALPLVTCAAALALTDLWGLATQRLRREPRRASVSVR